LKDRGGVPGAVPDPPPEKMTAALWPRPRDASIHAPVEVDARPVRALVAAADEHGVRVTPTGLVAKAAGQVLAEHPRLNRDVRGWRLRDRNAVDVWVTMTDEEGQLLGRRVTEVHERDLADVQTEVTEHGDAHEARASTGSKLVTNVVKWTPLPLLRGVARTLEFVLHTLRVPLGMMGIDREGFGGVHVTNVGPFGLRHVAAPIPPVTGQSFLVTVGEIHETPVVRGDEVVPGEVLPLTITLDHRLVVGIEAGRWADRFTGLLQDPDWMVGELPTEVRGDVAEAMDRRLAEHDEPVPRVTRSVGSPFADGDEAAPEP
jgi:hypothetical protein